MNFYTNLKEKAWVSFKTKLPNLFFNCPAQHITLSHTTELSLSHKRIHIHWLGAQRLASNFETRIFFFRIENTSWVVQGGFFPTCTFVRSKRRQFCNRHEEKFKLLSLLRFICRRLYQNYQLNNCFGLILRKDKWKAFFGLENSAASSFSGDSLCN